MRKVVMYCDRCKKPFEKWDNGHLEIIGIGEMFYANGESYIGAQKDLCKSCYTLLENWWYLGESKESECQIIHCKDCEYRGYWGDCTKWSKELGVHKSYILDKNMFCGFAKNKEQLVIDNDTNMQDMQS